MPKNEANKIYVNEYPVKIGQEDHKLRFDLEAFAALEEAGYEYEQIVDMATKISFKTTATLLWAGTKHEKHDLTEKDISQMIDIKGFISCQKTIQIALMNALPLDAPGENEPKKQDPETKNQE